MLQVVLDGPLGDEEFAGDLGVAQAAQDRRDDLGLALRKAGGRRGAAARRPASAPPGAAGRSGPSRTVRRTRGGAQAWAPGPRSGALGVVQGAVGRGEGAEGPVDEVGAAKTDPRSRGVVRAGRAVERAGCRDPVREEAATGTAGRGARRRTRRRRRRAREPTGPYRRSASASGRCGRERAVRRGVRRAYRAWSAFAPFYRPGWPFRGAFNSCRRVLDEAPRVIGSRV